MDNEWQNQVRNYSVYVSVGARRRSQTRDEVLVLKGGEDGSHAGSKANSVSVSLAVTCEKERRQCVLLETVSTSLSVHILFSVKATYDPFPLSKCLRHETFLFHNM